MLYIVRGVGFVYNNINYRKIFQLVDAIMFIISAVIGSNPILPIIKFM